MTPMIRALSLLFRSRTAECVAAFVALVAVSSVLLSAAPRVDLVPRLEADANRAFGLQKSRVVRLASDDRPGKPLSINVPLDGKVAVVDLIPQPIRGNGFKLLVQGADGEVRPTESGPVTTYRGTVRGLKRSQVAASLLSDGIHMRILDGDRQFWMEPLSGRVPGGVRGHHVFYNGEDVDPSGGSCLALAAANVAEVTDVDSCDGCGSEGASTVTASSVKIAELACDADFEYYLDYGSVAAVQSRIENVINAVNIQYERDVGIRHQITTILVRTAEPDPYSSTDALTLLNQFRNHWNANHGNISRDVAQLFTGKEIDSSTIGIAWLNAICTSYGYGLVQSDFNNNFSCATDLSAHELGHNWGADHCDCTSYTMNPYITCANVFNPVDTIPEIIQFRDSRTCLDDEPVDPPAAPSDLSAVSVSSSQIDLSWTDNALVEDGYDIERSIDQSSWTHVATLAANAVAYSDMSLSPSTLYYYRVSAFNGAGSSSYATDSATTDAPPPPPPPPLAPSGLTATALSDIAIQLDWNDNATTEDGFRLERSLDDQNWTQVADLPANTVTFIDSGLQASTLYYYRAVAYNDSGSSAYTATASATTDDPPAAVDQFAIAEYFVSGSVFGTYEDTYDADQVEESITEVNSKGKPSRRHSTLEHVWEFNVQAGSAVTVFAQAFGGSESDDFQFEVSLDGGANYGLLFTVPHTDDGQLQSAALSPATSGSVLVRVVDTDSSGGELGLDTVSVDLLFIRTDFAAGDPPAAPTGLTAEAISAGQITIGWSDASDDEYGFEIERSLDGGSTWESLGTTGPNVTGFDDHNVVPLTTYTYRVRAFNGSGNSGYADPASATTPDGPAAISLESATGYKVKGVQHADLTWSGAVGTSVMIIRGGDEPAQIVVSNTGSYTDNIGRKGGGTYTYQICETDESGCSETVTVSF